MTDHAKEVYELIESFTAQSNWGNMVDFEGKYTHHFKVKALDAELYLYRAWVNVSLRKVKNFIKRESIDGSDALITATDYLEDQIYRSLPASYVGENPRVLLR
jgi:phosphoenolpyruvate carboxylase